MLQTVALAMLAACWIAWAAGVAGAYRRRSGQKKVVRAPESKWGIALQMPSFSLVCAYVRPAGFEKSWPSLVVFVVGAEIRVWAYIPLIR